MSLVGALSPKTQTLTLVFWVGAVRSSGSESEYQGLEDLGFSAHGSLGRRVRAVRSAGLVWREGFKCRVSGGLGFALDP